MTAVPQCSFIARYPAGGGKWRYQRISPAVPAGAGIPMALPPSPGDIIILYDSRDPQPEGGPFWRVIERMFTYPVYGSWAWPYGEAEPRTGPTVEMTVEPAGGLFRDETDICGAEECEAFVMNGEWQYPAGAPEPAPHEHVAYRG